MLRFFRVDDAHPLTGWHALAIVSSFFAVIIAVNFTMAFLATGTFPGLVVENSYVASQNYNELLDAGRRQEADGWKAVVTDEAGRLQVRLVDRAGAPLHRLEVTAHAGRPSTTREDVILALGDSGEGYRAEQALKPGRWEIDLMARRDGALVWRQTREIFVPAGAGG